LAETGLAGTAILATPTLNVMTNNSDIKWAKEHVVRYRLIDANMHYNLYQEPAYATNLPALPDCLNNNSKTTLQVVSILLGSA